MIDEESPQFATVTTTQGEVFIGKIQLQPGWVAVTPIVARARREPYYPGHCPGSYPVFGPQRLIPSEGAQVTLGVSGSESTQQYHALEAWDRQESIKELNKKYGPPHPTEQFCRNCRYYRVTQRGVEDDYGNFRVSRSFKTGECHRGAPSMPPANFENWQMKSFTPWPGVNENDDCGLWEWSGSGNGCQGMYTRNEQREMSAPRMDRLLKEGIWGDGSNYEDLRAFGRLTSDERASVNALAKR